MHPKIAELKCFFICSSLRKKYIENKFLFYYFCAYVLSLPSYVRYFFKNVSIFLNALSIDFLCASLFPNGISNVALPEWQSCFLIVKSPSQLW